MPVLALFGRAGLRLTLQTDPEHGEVVRVELEGDRAELRPVEAAELASVLALAAAAAGSRRNP